VIQLLFVTPHLLYQMTGIVQEEEVYHPTTGKFLRTNRGIDAEFYHGTAPRWAMEIVMHDPRFHAAWSGLPDEQPREAMVSAYDTDVQAEQHQWTPETKEHVEKFLLNHPDHGVRYYQLDPPRVTMAEPWRGYDNTHHFKIGPIAKELEPDTQRYALEYERKNKNRESVVGDLVKLVGEDAEELAVA
jgi:hypothetical protein